MIKKFNPKSYSKSYYKRHLVRYREWENEIGKNIFETLKPSSIIDIGCGVGSYLEGALNAGCKDILGIEISFYVAKEFFSNDIAPYLQYGDATRDLNLNRTFDCVISVEVAEHVEPSGTYKFIQNLTGLADKFIIFTAAPPGQPGTGHINLRPKTFWIKQVESEGLCYRNDLTESFVEEWKKIRITNQKNKNSDLVVPGYILRNLMITICLCRLASCKD